MNKPELRKNEMYEVEVAAQRTRLVVMTVVLASIPLTLDSFRGRWLMW